jgi:arylsulfatase A-like enzyme
VAQDKKKKPPNLLIIIVDNQWAGALGCYGNTEHRTPNLDLLSRQGMRFSRGFCTNALCSPTRASLMTGLMPSQHGVQEPFNDDLSYLPDDWEAISEFRTLPLTLANRGYYNALVGKWHLGQWANPVLGFQHWVVYPKGHTTDFYNNTIYDNGKKVEVKGRHLVDFWAEKAAEFLDDYDDEKPFFLYVGFNGPYTMSPTGFGPDPQNPFYKDYEEVEFEPFKEHFSETMLSMITQPYDPNADPELVATDPMGMLKAMNAELFDYLRMHNDPTSRANIAAQNAMVDHGVGVIMKALERNKLEEDTLVLYLSDHAMPWGHHGWWAAGVGFPQVMYDQNVHIPFIMRHTGHIEANRVPDHMVSEYDVMPTILDYLGFGDVEIENSPGKSFAPLLKGEDIESWEEEVYFEHEETRCIRTPQYSYWKRLEGMEAENELYDLVKDPGEYENVYGKRGYKKIADELDKKVVKFFEKYSDPRYDLWNGGSPKLITYRPFKWPARYGKDWAVDTTLNPEFKE